MTRPVLGGLLFGNLCLTLEASLLGDLELLARLLEFLDELAQLVAFARGLAGEVVALEDAPLLQHRHHDVVEVDTRVIDAADGDDHGLAAELGTVKPGILKLTRTRCSECIAWSGAMSKPASDTSR